MTTTVVVYQEDWNHFEKAAILSVGESPIKWETCTLYMKGDTLVVESESSEFSDPGCISTSKASLGSFAWGDWDRFMFFPFASQSEAEKCGEIYTFPEE